MRVVKQIFRGSRSAEQSPLLHEDASQASSSRWSEPAQRRRSIDAVCQGFGTRLGLQRDSVRNQAEHVDVLWSSFCTRHGDVNEALRDLWSQLFRTLRDWRSRVWQPLANEASLSEAWSSSDDEALEDVCLFLLLWGELGNLRFCPELHCFLFMAARSFACPLSSTAGRVRSAEGSFLNGIVKPIFNVMVEETFTPGSPPKFKFGSAPAPSSAANYDDWNELFWDAERLRDSLWLPSSPELPGGGLLMEVCESTAQLWSKLSAVDWLRTLQGKKSHHELHSFLPMAVGFYRVFMLHSFILGVLLFLPEAWVDFSLFSWKVSPFALVIPIWMAIYEFGYQFMTPGCPWTTRCRGVLKLLLVYSLPAVTFVLAEFPVLDEWRLSSFSKIAWQQLLYGLHFATTLVVLLLALMPRSINHCGLGFYPSPDAGAGCGAWLFWLIVLSVFCLCSSQMLGSCGSALYSLYNLHAQGSESRVLLWVEVGVMFVPTGLCFFASLLYFTNIGIAICGSLQGVVRLGGVRLWWYRRGRGFTVLPVALYHRILKPKGDEWKGGYSTLKDPMAAIKASRWWEKMSDGELQAFLTVWDEMIADLRRRDLLSDEQVVDLLFGQDGFVNARAGKVPRLLDPADVLRISNSLPSCKEARRRLLALARSVQMQPIPQGDVRTMPSMTVVIPHYAEDILYTREALFQEGAPAELLRFLVKYYRQEFQNFAERSARAVSSGEAPSQMVRPPSPHVRLPLNSQVSKFSENVEFPADLEQRLSEWASMRMQTLWRTVQGLCDGYDQALDALVRIQEPALSEDERRCMIGDKFQVLLAMQRYGVFSDPSKEKDGHRLLASTESMLAQFGTSLKIAFIDEEEGASGKRYFAALIDRSCRTVQKPGRLMAREPKYRIELPGFPILGHGKSDNQNCAVIFSRGEVLQMIDCNQEAYFEAALFLPAALKEFSVKRGGRRPGILGFREHIFSDIGLLGRIAADSEFAFGTVIQRTMDTPLQARLHYGHPDMMDKLQVLQQGGVSKGTKGLNLSEDVFAGIDLTLRGGWTTYKEYFHVGKGRDMGFMSVLSFFAKVSMGNGEQATTRQWVRFGLHLSLPRLLGIFYTHIGYFLNQALVNWAIKSFAFMSAVFSLVSSLDIGADDAAVGAASSYFGFFYILFMLTTVVPLVMEVCIENGFCAACRTIASSLLALGPVFAAFQSKLMGYYFWSTLHYGGAMYIATGRGLAMRRESFLMLFRTFAATHMHDAFEIILYLIMSSPVTFNFGFYAAMGFTVLSWTMSPFIFNPRQFDSCVQNFGDAGQWFSWMCTPEGKEDESWVAWATRLQQNRKNSSWIVELFPSGRFLGLVATTLLVWSGSRFFSFMNFSDLLHCLILTPPFFHFLYCFAAVLFNKCFGDKMSKHLTTYPFLGTLAVGLTALELSAMTFYPHSWRLALFHKYMFVRAMLEFADGISVRQIGGPAFSIVHQTFQMWALSFRFVRDFLLGSLLIVVLSIFTWTPCCHTCHEYFLFRAHLNQWHYKSEKGSTYGRNPADSPAAPSGCSDYSDFEPNGYEDPLYTFVRRFSMQRTWRSRLKRTTQKAAKATCPTDVCLKDIC